MLHFLQCIKNITQRAQFNFSYNILVRRLNLSISLLSTPCALCGGSFFNNDFVQFYTFKLILVKIDKNGRQDLDNLLLYSLLTNLFKIRDSDSKRTFYILLHTKSLVKDKVFSQPTISIKDEFLTLCNILYVTDGPLICFFMYVYLPSTLND